ncbi:MAG: DUF4116 domain-containing protein, partial [Patescibacteria group bacterium]
MALNLSESPEDIKCCICWQDGLDFIESGCPSKHTFHRACIEAWFENIRTCPLCNQRIKFEFKSLSEVFEFLDKSDESDDHEKFMDVVSSINDFPLDWKIECLRKDSGLFEYIEDKTPELCRLAVENDGYALKYVPQEMKTPELCRLAVENYGYALKYVPEHMKTPELCRLAVENYGLALKSVPEKLKTSEIYRLAVISNLEVLKYVPQEMKTPELCRLAV